MTVRDYTTFETPLPHPGEHLREDYLPAFNLSAGALAKAMGLKDRSRVEQLVRSSARSRPTPLCASDGCSAPRRSIG
jgi:hypothetical protein